MPKKDNQETFKIRSRVILLTNKLIQQHFFIYEVRILSNIAAERKSVLNRVMKDGIGKCKCATFDCQYSFECIKTKYNHFRSINTLSDL